MVIVMVIVIAPLQVGVTDSQLLDTHLRFGPLLCRGAGNKAVCQTHESLFAVANN